MDNLLDENWKVLTTLFPPGWRDEARKSGAVERLRGFASPEELLRTLLLHVGRGYSLRETVVQAKAAGIAEVSDVALLKRLRNCEVWLRMLCLSLLRENEVALPEFKLGKALRIVDATVVKEPGPTGSLWRMHYSLRIPSLICDFFEITPTQGAGVGESFTRFPVGPGEFVLGDAGYSTPPGVEYLSRRGAYVLVRVNPQSLPLKSATGRPWALLPHLRSLTKAGRIGVWNVVVAGLRPEVRGRICALRKNEHSIRQAHQRLRRKSSKKGVRVQAETFEFAKYVVVFATFPKEDFSADEILEWYRVRWQIELVFKRLKSVAQLGHLPKYDERSSRAWLYAKMLVALLTQKLVRLGRDISPWGYLLPEAATSQ
jgi:hypothetical protein